MLADLKGLWRSFAAGEIAPELFSRIDLDPVQTGLALCKNYEVLPHGPIKNRAGFDYVLEAKFSARQTRLIPFIRSQTQTFVLEFGHLYVRFHTNDGTVVENALAVSAVTQVNPGVFTSVAHGYSNGQTVFLAGFGGMTAINGRFLNVANATADTFTLQDFAGVPLNTSALPAYTGGGTVARVYEVVTPYDETVINLLTLHYVQSVDVLTLVHQSYPQQELRRITDTNWTLTAISFDPDVAAPTAVTFTTPGASTIPYQYTVTAISATTLKESFAATPSIQQLTQLTALGFANNISWTGSAGAVRYNVYSNRSGLYCYIGQSVGTSFRDDNITPDTTTTPPTTANPFTGANTYPGTVSYFQQRRVFAGSINAPQNVWMTRSATESILTSSLPIRDDDAIVFKISAREANTIKHIVPLKDLILLSGSAAWQVVAQNSDVLTPKTISINPQSYYGASDAQPVVVGQAAIYGEASGAHILELSYRYEVAGYKTTDISLLAPHLFDGLSIVDLAYAPTPKIIWGVRSDGVLLGCTYVPDNKVLGWHQHTTINGFFESIAVVPEGPDSALWALIRRTINGRTVRYVEHKRSRQFATLADSFLVDSGATLISGSPVSVITSGLWHLEGQTVSVLVDGAVQPRQVVTNGAITLQNAGSKIQVGLPITADAQLLPFAQQSANDGGYGQGVQKNVNAVNIRVNSTSQLYAGPSFTKLRQFKQRTTENYGTPPSLVTGVINIVIDNSWGPDGQVCFRQTDPLPVTIQSAQLEMTLGD